MTDTNSGQDLPHYFVFTGSRTWTDEKPVHETLKTLRVGRDVVVHGGCKRGLDAIVHRLARTYGLQVLVEPADWRKHGRAAGPKRNAAMLAKYKPRTLFAFVKLDPGSGQWTPGTKCCVQQAHSMGIRVQKVFDRETTLFA